MRTLSRIERLFELVAHVVGGVFLLPPHEALEFIAACRDARAIVYGADGFRMYGDQIQPQQEHILDLGKGGAKDYDTLDRFIRDRSDSSLWFEVTHEMPPPI